MHTKYLLQEWEVYVLAKLNWNVPGLVATDFVDHILKVSAVFLLVNQMNHCLHIGCNTAFSLAITCLWCTSLCHSIHTSVALSFAIHNS